MIDPALKPASQASLERIEMQRDAMSAYVTDSYILRRTWVRQPQRVAGGSAARRTNAGIVISVKFVQQRG